jgi:hypothetical protein
MSPCSAVIHGQNLYKVKYILKSIFYFLWLSSIFKRQDYCPK